MSKLVNFQVKETEDLLEAASNLAQCMNGQCCPVISRRRRQAAGDTCTEFKDNTMNTFSPSQIITNLLCKIHIAYGALDMRTSLHSTKPISL